MAVALDDIQDLTRQEYEDVRRLVYDQSGINLGAHKMQLVRARLGKRVRKGGFKSFGEYFEHVHADSSGQEMSGLLDCISTNTTHLFREIKHFHLLAELIDGWASDKAWRAKHKTLRIWSAASSSGEEPYSIAMVAHDTLRKHPGLDLKILATDISVQMLAKAQRGVFEADRIGPVPPAYKSRYLRKVQVDGGMGMEIVPEIRQLIKFARFNLMSSTFPFRNAFNVIFCRNVMIYFDKETQQTLVNKFADHMHEGAYLYIGHSESLNNQRHPFAYVEPTVYRK